MAPPRSGISAVSLFWLTLLALVIVGVPLGASRGTEGVGVVVLILALVLPGVMLAAGVVTLVILAIVPLPDKAYQMWQLGKIMLGIVVGAAGGILVMVGIYALFTIQ
jgi:hypothetical protein